MISRLVFLLFCGNISLNLGNAQKLPRVKRQSLKVQINATGDAVCLRYIRPSPSIKLEGFILGYGSSFFSNQYIPLPSDGKPYITEVDAEPRYLIAVRPAPVPNYRKSCSGQTKTPKPLQLVIGTLTPTSVFLSWGVLINPKHDWITMNNCANDRFYTVRYREKDKNKKWILQLCPTTETVVDNLKPNIIYEFGVKDNTDNGIWSKTLTHNTVGSYKIKENGYLQNNNKLPKIQTQLISVDPKAGSPVTMIKEVIKNITHRTQAKTTEKSPLAGPILVHLIVPDFNQAKQKQLSPFPEDMSERSKKILAENNTLQWPAESKTSEIQEISPQSQPDTTELDWESSRPTVSSVSGEPKSFLAHTESELESSKPRISSMAELPLDTLAPHKFPEFPKIHTPTLQTPRGKLASHEMQPVPSQPQTTAPKTTQTKLAVTNEPILESLTPKTAKLDWPRATLVPSETPLTPFKWKPSATPEGLLVKPASKPPPLEQNIPKTSRITERLKTTPALPETKFVPSTTKPAQHKIPETKPEKEPQWESTTPKIYKNPELPRTTQALSKTKITVSKPQILPHLEEPKTVPAVTTKLVPVPVTTKVSHITAYPVTTMASSEPASIPSQSKETDYTMPEVPDNKPALDETDLFSSKPSTVPELPLTKSVLESITFNNELPIIDPKVKHHLFSTKTTISPHILQTKPVLQTTTFRPQPPMTEREEEDQEPSKPKILFSPDVSQTKPDLETITFRPEKPKTTTAPKETRRVPARAKTSASPGITSTKPGSKGSRRVVSRAKTSPSPNVTQTKPASAVEYFFPNKSKPSPRPRILETKPALYQTTSQPLTIKPTLSSGHLKTTMAPKETKFIPSKPKTSGKPEISQTKPAPVETIPGSINLHIHVLNDPKDTSVPSKLPSRETTESPHVRTAFHKVYLTTAKPKTTDKSQTRSVIHKTTPAPGRTRTAGRAIWGDILTEQDITRLFSTSASASTNVSADSTVARKKSDSVATPPDPPRPPLAPAKPTPMRRKPLPPNTVTGKPGSSGNILMPRAPPLATASSVAKPMRPTVLVRTGSPKKPPTASASPDYSNTTVFSLQPTSETDIAGKPRYKGDHVRYMKKEGDVPCSITDTLQHFPKEEGDNKNALSPPNNPPTNLTVVTVEGCASFVVLDWEKPENDTVTEYKVVSTENGAPDGKDKSVITTNLTHSTVENLKPNTSYEFLVIPSNPLGEGPSSETKAFKTESADPRVNEQISMGKDAIWTEIKFSSDDYSECKGKQYVKRTWYKKFVGVQLCNSLRYKIYLSDSLAGKFYNIGDQRGHGEDHCQFVDSYFDGKTGQQLQPNQLATKDGFFRAFRQEPVKFGKIGAATHTNYVHWYECGTTIPGKW